MFGLTVGQTATILGCGALAIVLTVIVSNLYKLDAPLVLITFGIGMFAAIPIWWIGLSFTHDIILKGIWVTAGFGFIAFLEWISDLIQYGDSGVQVIGKVLSFLIIVGILIVASWLIFTKTGFLEFVSDTIDYFSQK